MIQSRLLPSRPSPAWMTSIIFVAAAAVADLARADDSTAAKSKSREVAVITAADERITGPLADFRSGLLIVDSKPPRSIDLMDLQRLSFGSVAGVAAQWLGQDQHDLVGVGSTASGNGIQDIHLRLTGLPAEKQIKQLRVLLRSPLSAWRLDTAESPDWRLVVERFGNSPTAEVFLEPPASDVFNQQFQITLTYSDGSTEKIACAATTHTSDKLKTGAQTADAEKQLHFKAELGAGDVVVGKLVQMTDESLTLKTTWQPNVRIPLLHVQGLLCEPALPEAASRYQQALVKPGSEDLAIVAAKDGGLAEIPGHLKQWECQQLHFVYEGQEQTIQTARVQALVLAAHPPVHSTAAFQVVRLQTGDTLSGSWLAVNDNSISMNSPWGDTWEIPIESISEIGTRNGNLVHLSDLDPVSVEQVPYFGRLMHYRRDQSLEGSPLKIKGKFYAKGLAVHSRCLLAYTLDGQFANFKTLVGFDDDAGTRGRVNCRVLADGKELFANPDLRADQEPQTLDLSVAGAKLLTLEVDFCENEDTGDRVIWAQPRLFRK
jgi:hypothetical protein